MLDSILDSSWVGLGVVLVALGGPFADPNRVELSQKCVLNYHFFENGDVQRGLTFLKVLGPAGGRADTSSNSELRVHLRRRSALKRLPFSQIRRQ